MARSTALVTALVLAASLAQALTPPAAVAAGGPSVPLPETESTAVAGDVMRPRDLDDAGKASLSGNQPAKAAKEGAGSATAQPLSPTSTWDVSAHTGDFTWSYPLRVPPVPGGLVPDLALSYQSSAVDGLTSATNNQASWVGDGWTLGMGSIDRTYLPCADDTGGGTTPPKTGDLCWRDDNATASYPGGGGPLVRDEATGAWRPREDDGSRIELIQGGVANGDNDGEHWRVTTVDGTQYLFGSQADSGATWTIPVFGDDANEPCNNPSSFDASHCAQAWRWNLDKIVDRNGNVVRLHYERQANSYGLNLKDTAVSYTRGGALARIDYGLREDLTTPAARVVFTTADRCVPGSECVPEKRDNWPDVPWEAGCSTATCKDNYSPSFWTTKRLARVTTEVWDGTRHAPVDEWALDHQFPDPGGGDKAALWLKSIVHTGLVGGSAAMPAVTFEGTALGNRVDTVEDGLSALNRYRVTGVLSESGGVTSVRYESECRPGGPMPTAPESNTLRCFPARWAKKDHAERTDHFHKYVVASVVRSDRMASGVQQETRYEYLDGAAWHWDTSEFAKDDKKTWNEFRGFGRVRVRTGAADDQSGPVTMAEQRFYRGMDGDKLPSGTRSVSVSDSAGGVRTDHDWLRGWSVDTSTFEREGPSDQPDPPRVRMTVTEPSWQGPTATRGTRKSYVVVEGSKREHTALAAGGWRVTRTDTTYDAHGLVEKVNDLGDVSTPADDLCARTEYARDAVKWMMNRPSRVEVVSVACDATPVFPDHAVSDTRATHDANGNVIKVEVADRRPAAGPEYTVTRTAEHDKHGRVKVSTDGVGDTTRTAYTPEYGGPLTQTVSTGPPTAAVPAGMSVTTALNPAWGKEVLVTDPNGRKTETAYDPLGRVTAVWQPNRPRSTNPTRAGVRHAYLIRNDGPSAVTTTRIGPNGTDITTTTLHDGFLRVRQAQAPAIGGGRLLTDTRYDSRGRAWKKTQPYFNDAAVDTTLWLAADADIPGHTRTLHDGAGREVASVYFGGANEMWRSTTAHGGDRTHVTPPAGGTATTKVTDGRGRVVELREYAAPTPTGGFDTTTYAYTPSGRHASVTDPAGNTWRFGYDLRGRRTSTEDPDTGTTVSTYDKADRLSAVRDATGATIAYAYDSLGRRTGSFVGQVGGVKLAEWAYDTVSLGKGRMASATRWVDGKAYVNRVISYNALYQPTGKSLTIPSDPAWGLLARTYESYLDYDPDGSLSAETYPAGGELPEETVNYDYHDLGMPSTSSGAFGGTTYRHVTATEYTRYGEQARVQLGTGTKRAWLSSYYDDHTRRLTRYIVDAEIPSPMVADFHYTRDPAGNVTSIADTPLSAPADVQCFRQDHLGRTTQAWTPAASAWSQAGGCQGEPATAGLSGPAPYWLSYDYDKAGNRLTETSHAAAGDTTRTYGYGVPGHAHALGSVTTTVPGGATSVENYGYEAAGRTETRTRGGVGQQLTWTIEGRLGKVVEGAKTTSFVYTADGSRLLRKDATGTTLYLGNQELRLAASGGNPTVTRYYSHGDRTVAMRQGRGALTWLAQDHQETAQIAVRSDTLAVTRRRQQPFGGPRGAAVTWPGERGFLGGAQDPGLGLTHLGAREYDPAAGRFLSVDPIMDLADPQQMNGYAYADNNPLTYSDPSGKIRAMCPDGDCQVGRSEASKSLYKDPPSDPLPPWFGPSEHPIPGEFVPFEGPYVGKVRPFMYCEKPTPSLVSTSCSTQIKRWTLYYVPKECQGPKGPITLGCAAIKGEIDLEHADHNAVQAWLEEMRKPKNPHTLALCVGGAIYAGAGVGYEACLAYDGKGFGWSNATKVGLGAGAGFSADAGIKLSEGTIKDLGGTGTWFSVPLPRGLGVEGGRSDDGKGSVSVNIGVDGGIGGPPLAGRESGQSGYFDDDLNNRK